MKPEVTDKCEYCGYKLKAKEDKEILRNDVIAISCCVVSTIIIIANLVLLIKVI